MSASVNAFLVPGSTGDAWEMSNAEQAQVLEFAIDFAKSHDSLLLLGALKPDAPTTRDAIQQMRKYLKRDSRVCGFVACAPTGRELSQEQMRDGLRNILDLGVPTALYQLPQVTQNEIPPAMFAELSKEYPNFLMFKDSSGADKVAMDDRGRAGVFLVRGAEGKYAQMLREAGGPYHGLLLSTANSFPRQLRSVIDLLKSGQTAAAITLSDQLSGVVEQVFRIVKAIPHGNPFANANKAMDHFMAFGRDAMSATPPRLHAGVDLPREALAQVHDLLEKEGLLPATGYLFAKQ
jgi:dihydrodipicolinate synthase/N-acetylneuraminate lyase